MTQAQIKESIKEGRVQLPQSEMMEYYFPVLILIFLACFCLYFIISELGIYSQTGDYITASIVGTCILSITAYFTFKRHKALNYKILRDYTSSGEEFKNIVKASAITGEWNIKSLTDQLAIAEKIYGNPTSRKFKFLITILRENDQIYFNSRLSPPYSIKPFASVDHKENFHAFKQHLVKLARGLDVIEEAKVQKKEEEIRIETEPEWNRKNTLNRVAVYIFMFIILVPCGISLNQEFDFRVFLVIALCIGYIAVDWIIIMRKMDQ